MKNIVCNLCGEDDAELLYELNDRMVRVGDQIAFYLWQCRKCGLGYLNPQPEWKDLEYFYGGAYYTNAPCSANGGNILYRGLRRAKRALFGAYQPKFWNFGKAEGKFLDVGCGNAAYEAYVIKNYPGWEFYAVEPSGESAKLARQVPRLKIFEGFLEEAKYPNDFFDVILMSHSLEHNFNPFFALREANRILKPGGRMVIMIPNFDSLARKIFGRYWYHLDAPRHLFHFSPKTIAVMLENAGFKIELLDFEALSDSILRSIAYRFSMGRFFFERPLILLGIHYLILPFKKIAEFLKIAAGQRIIASKPIND